MSRRKTHPLRHADRKLAALYPIAVALLSLAAALILLLGSEVQARMA